ncbi:hypothetical protein R6Q59_011773 [Mikania micrantha]
MGSLTRYLTRFLTRDISISMRSYNRLIWSSHLCYFPITLRLGFNDASPAMISVQAIWRIRVLKNGGSSGDFSYCNNHLALWLLFSFSVGDVRNCLHATWVLWLQFYSPNSLLQATTVTKGFFKLKQLQVEMDNACLANKARLTQMNHFFEDAFHSSCEGIMVKSLDVEAGYLPSKRSYSWLKWQANNLKDIGYNY